MKLKTYQVFMLLFIFFTCFCMEKKDYYSELGIRRTAKVAEIHTACAKKKFAIDQQYKDLTQKINQALKDKKEYEAERGVKDRVKLERYKSQIQTMCNTLKNPRSRAEYDTELYKKEADKRKEEEIIRQYCVQYKEKILNPKIAWRKSELKVGKSKGVLLPGKEAEAESEINQMEREKKQVIENCEILKNPQHPRYQATFEKVKQEIEQGRGPLAKARNAAFGGDRDAKAFTLLGDLLSRIKIPDAAFKIFNQNLTIKDMRFVAVQSSLLPMKLDRDVMFQYTSGDMGGDKSNAPIRISGEQIRKGLGFTGTISFNTFTTKATGIVIEDYQNKPQFSLAIELPDFYKLSTLLPQLKALDRLSLPKGKLILSTFEYTDLDMFQIKPGLNFESQLDLSGPLEIFGNLMKKANETKAIIVRAEPIRFGGIIHKDISRTELSGVIPIQLGVDFSAIPKIPKPITSIFKEFTTDEFVFTMKPPPASPLLSAEVGVRLILGTQDAPIRLSLRGSIEEGSFSLGSRMRNMLDLKIIALGNAGIQLDFDSQVLPIALSMGIPFTGLGVYGQIDLGTAGDKRISLNVTRGARLTKNKGLQVVSEVEGKNIQFANLIYLFTKVLAKAKIGTEVPLDKIPSMTIHQVRGYFNTDDTYIAGKYYSAGFGLSLDAELFDKKFGLGFDIAYKQKQASGRGYLPPIVIRGKKGPIFALTGGASSDPFNTSSTDGAEAFFSFGYGEPKPEVNLEKRLADRKAYLERIKQTREKVEKTSGDYSKDAVRLLKKEQDIQEEIDQIKRDIQIQDIEKKLVARKEKKGMIADIKEEDRLFTPREMVEFQPPQEEQRKERKAKEFVLDGRFGVKGMIAIPALNLKSKIELEINKRRFLGDIDAKIADFNVIFGFDLNPKSLLESYIKFGFKADFAKFLSQQAKPFIENTLKDVDAKLAHQIVKLRNKGRHEIQAEIDKTKATINRIENEIKTLKEECSRAKGVKKIPICTKVGLEIAAQEVALTAQRHYLNGLLSPTRKTFEKTTTTAKNILYGISRTGALEKASKGLSAALELINKGLTIFNVKEAIGQIGLKELTQGLGPRIISFVAEVRIPEFPAITIDLYDLQFDFKNPAASAQNIAKKLLSGIKLEK